MSTSLLKRIPAILLVALLLPLACKTQPGFSCPAPPERRDFVPLHAYLSAGRMEGREAGTAGDSLAAGFIVAMMQQAGLTPFGDAKGWYQSFTVMKFLPEHCSLTLKTGPEGGNIVAQWIPWTDVVMDTVPFEGSVEAVPVFAGYGLVSAAAGYDDYLSLDLTGRVAVIMKGFPGHHDTTTPGGTAFARAFGGETGGLLERVEMARKKGAVAVILLDGFPGQSPEKEIKSVDTLYDDQSYYLPGKNRREFSIPCFRLSAGTSAQLVAAMGIDGQRFERNAARGKIAKHEIRQDVKVQISSTLRQRPVEVRNILGMIPGKDTGRFVLIGAHYDHLGIRNGRIFYGADDNASGVAGMLALASAWSRFGSKPPCNLIFASWTAEEKGILGSEYFVDHDSDIPDKLSLVINLDMISRSAPEDTACRILSIGTLPADEELRLMARKINERLPQPLQLDLWDVAGHCGSDYCHFARKNIPVMTFFSGYQEDYHTPRDRFERTDPAKMEKILRLVNECLGEGLLWKRKP